VNTDDQQGVDIDHRMDRLKSVAVFAHLPESALRAVAERASLEHYPRGETIFHEGDLGDALYILEAGQVEVFSETSQKVLAYLGPGSFFGETALLLRQPRSATLRVAIDASCWVIPRGSFEPLLETYPQLSRELILEAERRLVSTSRRRQPVRRTPITAVYGGHMPGLAQALARQLNGTVGLAVPPSKLSCGLPRDFNAPFHRTRAFTLPVAPGAALSASVSRWIQQVEHLLLPVQGPEDPTLSLAHQVVCTAPAPPWLKQAAGELALIETLTDPASLKRAARRLAGQAIGFVLSSGGGKTAAHAGVIRVLRELALPIDHVAGTSGGALFGAMFAAGWPDEKIAALTRELPGHNSFRNWDIALPPRAGIARGRRMRELFDRWFEGRTFADLHTPLVVVATDLATGREVQIDSGPLADAIRASVSIPGILEPWPHDGGRTFLVDGAAVNPLPASVVRDRGADRVVASSVVKSLGEATAHHYSKMPHMLQTISRLMSSIERELIKTQLPQIDVLIHPLVTVDHALDFSEAEALMLEGERVARRHDDALRALKRMARGESQPDASASSTPRQEGKPKARVWEPV